MLNVVFILLTKVNAIHYHIVGNIIDNKKYQQHIVSLFINNQSTEI